MKNSQKLKKMTYVNGVVASLKSKRNKSVNTDKFLGQNIAAGLQNIIDNKSKEYIKGKMQELIFQA